MRSGSPPRASVATLHALALLCNRLALRCTRECVRMAHQVRSHKGRVREVQISACKARHSCRYSATSPWEHMHTIPELICVECLRM
eukprot:52157-Eustigmatos_ZCMA.PRE.1